MKVATGSYTGNGVSGTEIVVGFEPDLVIINGVYFTTSAHPAGSHSSFASNIINGTGIITGLTAAGFTVGTNAGSNANGTVYYWAAFMDTGANDFVVGSYVGTGAVQNISLSFLPNMVAIKGNAAQYGWWRTSAVSGDNTFGFAGFRFTTNLITALTATGFSLGTAAGVNQSGSTYYYFAFGNNAGAINVGAYIGNATSGRSITIGLQPAVVFIDQDNPNSSVCRFSSLSGDASFIFGSSSLSSNMIQSFTATTFTVGSSAYVNENNTPSDYFAVSAGFTTIGQTFTAKASVVNPTVRFTAKAKVKNILSKTATSRGWIKKNVAGPLANLPYRGVDVMKWTKDTTKSQPSDATIENIVRFLQENMNLTHLALVLPIDPLSWYPSGYTPAPRTIIGTYQKWADEIHNRGLKILHRPVAFGMEGRENFLWRVGSNRYPQGRKQEIIPTTFTDNFNRANIYTAITAETSTFSDDFNRATIGTTDWNTPIGTWSIVSDELVCDNVANAASNIIYTKQSYTDFTLTAKVKKVSLSGFCGVAFRMSRDTNNGGRAFANYLSGYLLELRDGNVLRVENIATANLIQVTKAWTAGTYYQVKIQCTGPNIKIRVWADGTSEPGTWDIDFNDTTYSSGGVGFCPENTNTRAVFDDLFIAFQPTASVTSDWNTVGAWAIDSNTVKCTNAAAQYSNLMYSKATYSNFTYQAKVKNVGGTTAVVFRLTKGTPFPGYSGYTARIRNNAIFEIEDLSVANLASVAKTFVVDTWYQVKIECVGSAIKARVWEDGTAEPSTWDIELTHTKYTTGSIGFAPENVSAAFFDDATVTVAQNLNTWLGLTYSFIVDNPTLFANGDIWAPYPERTEGIFQDGTSFISYSSPGVQANYANFFADLKDVCDYAFAQIGKTGVITGWSADNYSEIRSGWIPQTLYDRVGIVAMDYYQNYSQDLNFTGARAKTDIDAVYNARGKQVVWQEWGPVPDMITNISSTSGQAINGYGNIKSPNENYGSNREVFIRDFYTTALVAAFNEGKLLMFNYWGFWDTGDNDTGLAKISGSTATYSSFKFRREGWILAEYFHPGASPQKTVAIKARVQHTTAPTFTAKAKIVTAALKSFTAKARVSNPQPTDKTIWVDVPDDPTTWTVVVH